MPRARTVTMFIVTVLVFLFIANFVVYEALKLSFGDVLPSAVLAAVLAIGALSFIPSIVLGRKRYNLFTRVHSLFSMLWMGFFSYLFLASFVYILEVALFGDPKHAAAIIIFALPILAALYGFIYARRIQVKEVTVELANLPHQWRGKKVAFVSDLHIGQIKGKQFVELVIAKIKMTEPDIVFIGGDLFDGSYSEEILEMISPFQHFLPAGGIYFILGNHEGYGAADLFLGKIKEVGIKVLRDEKVIVDGVQIIGVDFLTTEEKEPFAKILENVALDREMPSILLKHEPQHIDITEAAGISFQMSGHTHKAQQWPFEYFARMAYGRFTYGLHRSNETQVYTSSGVGTWGPPMRVGTDSEIVVFTFN